MKRARWVVLLGILAAGAATIGIGGCGGGDGGTPLVGSEGARSAVPVDPGQAEVFTFGQNVVRNGGAEANIGGTTVGTGPAPAGWTRTGNLEVMKYGGGSGFPTLTTPGPLNRGKNFFSGGPVPPGQSKIQQTASLSWAASVIDAGNATYSLSAWLGGYASHGDNAKVEVKFLNAVGTVLATKTIGPVTAAQRGNATKFLLRSASGTVPRKARSAKIEVIMTEVTGYNDGYADNVALVLRHRI